MSEGLEHSLCASGQGGTCSSSSSVPPPVHPYSQPVQRTVSFYFLPPATPFPSRKNAKGSMKWRFLVPLACRRISGFPTRPVATSPRTPKPQFFDRKALRASAQSLLARHVLLNHTLPCTCLPRCYRPDTPLSDNDTHLFSLSTVSRVFAPVPITARATALSSSGATRACSHGSQKTSRKCKNRDFIGQGERGRITAQSIRDV
ncbi:hypothetical protein EDB83DRAFT_181331 [Lactarius deliciosus]|nr:hypothetical protein EDB83DRAFT_181331 [Lactarius deliciosus]